MLREPRIRTHLVSMYSAVLVIAVATAVATVIERHTPVSYRGSEMVYFIAVCFLANGFGIVSARRVRKLEQERIALRAELEAKKRFLATVAHETRTPMVGVIGLVELLSLQDLGSEANEIVRIMFDSSKRLLQTVNNILEASKLERGQVSLEFSLLPVRSLVADVGQLISGEARKKGIRVLVSCGDNVPEYVCGDGLQVRQVLLNLAFNAVKFTERGDVHLEAEVITETRDNIGIRFSVIDSELVYHLTFKLSCFSRLVKERVLQPVWLGERDWA